MQATRDQLTNPGRRLPDISLPSAVDGSEKPIRPRARDSVVLVLVDAPGCARCTAHLRELSTVRTELEEWDGRLLVVLRELAGASRNRVGEIGGEFAVLLDPEGKVGAALGLQAPATVVADQWGEVHAAEAAGEDHRFVSPADLVQWARYLAVSCPECEGEAL